MLDIFIIIFFDDCNNDNVQIIFFFISCSSFIINFRRTKAPDILQGVQQFSGSQGALILGKI